MRTEDAEAEEARPGESAPPAHPASSGAAGRESAGDAAGASPGALEPAVAEIAGSGPAMPSGPSLEADGPVESRESGHPGFGASRASESESVERRRGSRIFAAFGAGDRLLLNRYRVLEEFGRGNMGVVHLAYDTKLERRVALKTLRDEFSEDPVRVERFRREIEAISGLRHPSIVPVHDIGEFEGRFWFIMDYIEGESLATRLRRESLEPRQAFEVVLPICRAVAYAHECGIVHRDIKPENILIDRNGSPYLTDFGLAFRLRTQTRLTATGHSVGTPAFMAPEQITGTERVGARTDIYALGATLYECLTGRLLFAESETYAELVYEIVNAEPAAPRHWRPALARDAEAITLHCLEKNPDHRYQSAGELAEDIERFLRGEAVSASGPGLMRRFARFAGRHWSLIAGLLVALSGLLLAIGLVLNQRADYERAQRIQENLERERETLLRVYQRSLQEEIRNDARDRRVAGLLMRGGAGEQELAVYRQALALDRTWWIGHYGQARVYIRQALRARSRGERDESRRVALRALQQVLLIAGKAPEVAEVRVFEADLRLDLLGQRRESEDLYLQALQLPGALAVHRYARARIAAMRASWEACKGELDLIAEQSRFPACRVLLAEALVESGLYARARAVLSELEQRLERSPGESGLFHDSLELERLRVLLALREAEPDPPSKATREALAKLRRRLPADTRLLAAEARITLSEGAFDSARRLIEQALTEAPRDAALWELRGRRLELTGDAAAATKALARAEALRLAPLPPIDPRRPEGESEEPPR